MITPIADLGMLSDCRSAALVSRAGEVLWWCPSAFDGAAVFAGLLGDDAGSWSLVADDTTSTTRSYVDQTLVLRSEHVTRTGTVVVTDALLLAPGAQGHDIGLESPGTLVRLVICTAGRVRVRTRLAPRPEHGRITPHVVERDGAVELVGGRATLTLRTSGDVSPEIDIDHERAVVHGSAELTESQVVGLELAYSQSYGDPAGSATDPVQAVADTVRGWVSWSDEHQSYEGRHRTDVLLGSRVLQGLTYQRSGAVVAAPTTSLPEEIGGDRNYDYRYAWLRDFSFTMRSLWIAACPDETDRLLQFVAGAIGRVGPHPVPVMCGIEGERDLTEHELEHLAGYAGSRPVRVGNAAWQQRQHDVLGEVVDAAHQLRDTVDEFSPETQAMLVGLADKAAATWREPDAGMWEARDQERHYTSSKVLCWVAVDRAIDLAARIGASDQKVASWGRARDDIRTSVLTEAWDDGAGAYAGAYGSGELDASVLVLPLVGFLDAADERMRATIDAVERELATDGLVRRWRDDPAGFVLCSCWLAECRVLTGELDRAIAIIDRVRGGRQRPRPALGADRPRDW